MRRLFANQRFSFYLIIALCLYLPACHGFCSARGNNPFSVFKLAAANVQSEKLIYVGELPATGKGKPAATVKLKAASSASQFVMFSGNLNFSGKLTPEDAGGSLPGTLRFQLKHKSSSGAVLLTLNFDIKVETDGTIKVQKLPFNVTTLVTPKQSVEVAVIPLDKNLSDSNANLKIAYVAPPGSSPETETASIAEQEEPVAPNSEARKIQFTYVGLVPPTAKNVEHGDYRFSTTRGPSDPLNGTLSVKGKLTSVDSSPIPRQLQLVVKHTTSTGSVLRTEKFDVNVASDGTIALQKFPITTENAAGTKESLQFSAIAVDKNFPLSSINITMTYVHT